jgi:fibronectin type 3 domain-containing protein
VSWDIYDGTYFYDTELSPDTTYSYRIKAVNNSGSSGFSSSASAKTNSSYNDGKGDDGKDHGYTLNSPNVTATAYSGVIEVYWDWVSGADYYEIYRYSSGEGIVPLGETMTTSYTDYYYDLSPDTAYYYGVIAKNSSGGESDVSEAYVYYSGSSY